jgi:hypothetical protein
MHCIAPLELLEPTVRVPLSEPRSVVVYFHFESPAEAFSAGGAAWSCDSASIVKR